MTISTEQAEWFKATFDQWKLTPLASKPRQAAR